MNSLTPPELALTYGTFNAGDRNNAGWTFNNSYISFTPRKFCAFVGKGEARTQRAPLDTPL